MNKKNASLSNPASRLSLLWGSHTNPGRSGLTTRAIVESATRLTDEEGIEALSMRNVAERLGVGTMSLYTHIPSKADLIDLMLDAAYGELYTSVEEPSQQPGDWREALRFIARRNWDLYLKHPWILQITVGWPILGPHTTLKYEAELRPLDGLGLSDVEMDSTLTLVLAHVEGCARAHVIRDRTQRESGMTDAEWWVLQEPVLARLIDGSLFPVAERVGTASSQQYEGASNPNFALTFGLERILDGVSMLIRDGQRG